jgi:hypothetical protein
MASGVGAVLIDPKLTVTRFAQLQPGDLFIHPYEDGGFVAIKVKAPDGDMLFVPIGPRFPHGLAYPSLLPEPAATVISFGKEYVVRLPESWRSELPPPEKHCIVLAEGGAYVRANFIPRDEGYKPCYIALLHRTSRAQELRPRMGNPHPRT